MLRKPILWTLMVAVTVAAVAVGLVAQSLAAPPPGKGGGGGGGGGSDPQDIPLRIRVDSDPGDGSLGIYHEPMGGDYVDGDQDVVARLVWEDYVGEYQLQFDTEYLNKKSKNGNNWQGPDNTRKVRAHFPSPVESDDGQEEATFPATVDTDVTWRAIGLSWNEAHTGPVNLTEMVPDQTATALSAIHFQYSDQYPVSDPNADGDLGLVYGDSACEAHDGQRVEITCVQSRTAGDDRNVWVIESRDFFDADGNRHEHEAVFSRWDEWAQWFGQQVRTCFGLHSVPFRMTLTDDLDYDLGP